jgi:sulfoxide reductase heme-binding subunit YedZ
MLGLYAFFYATLHLSTYIFLFSGYDLPTVWAGLKGGHLGAIVDEWKVVWPTISDDLKKRRFIQVGFFAWCLLLVLAATSPAFVMRAMGGKWWRRVHWFVYVAAYLGLTHYWWLVKKGVMAPLPFTVVFFALLAARVFWWVKGKIQKRQRGKPLAVGS